MDHGADCIITGISTMAYLQIVNPSLGWVSLAFVLLFMVFFIVTLEEYYFEALDFPIINAVNEGTTSTFFILLLGVFLGNEVYQHELVFGLNVYQVIFIGLFALIVLQCLYIVIRLLINFPAKDVLLKLSLFSFVCVSAFLVFFWTDNEITAHRTKVPMYIYTILFSRVIISIMIAHIFKSNFDQFQVFPFLLSTIMILLVLVEKFALDGKPQTTH